MSNIYAVAILAFKEGVKQRIIYGLLIAASLILALSVLLCGFFLRDVSKVLLDFCLATTTLGGLCIPFFVAIHMLSKDIERRTIFTVLTRPLSRGQYIIGKFVGLSLLTLLIMMLLGCLTWCAVQGGEFLFGARFFSAVSWPDIARAIFLSFLSILILNAIAVLWSTLTTSSFLATLLVLSSYVIGHFVDDVVRFLKANASGVDVVLSIQYTIDFVKYLFPNLAAFDVKQAAAHGMSIPVSDVFFLTGYALAYVAFLLTLSTFLFNKRDFA